MRCPILPIFLTAVLGAPVAARDIAEGAAAVTKLVAGRAADTVARRRLIALGYGLAAAGKIILAVAAVWPVVLLARGIDRLGKGVRGAPRDALLVQGVLAADRGKAFGLHRAVDTAGAVVGPAVGLTLYDLFGHHIRPPLIVAIGPAVASVLLVAVSANTTATTGARSGAHPDTADPRAATATSLGRHRPTHHVRIRQPPRRTPAAPGMRTRVLPGSSHRRLHRLQHRLRSPELPPGALSDRLSRPRICAIGLLCFAIGYLGLGLINDPRWAAPKASSEDSPASASLPPAGGPESPGAATASSPCCSPARSRRRSPPSSLMNGSGNVLSGRCLVCRRGG